jgi:hypothetical protein
VVARRPARLVGARWELHLIVWFDLANGEPPLGFGAAWHIGRLAQRVPLHPLPAGAQRDTKSIWESHRAQKRLPVELRQQLLDAIYTGQPFRQILRNPQT